MWRHRLLPCTTCHRSINVIWGVLLGLSIFNVVHATDRDDHAFLRNGNVRQLAGDDEATVGKTGSFCHDKYSFLGVGNTECVQENWGTAMFLLAVIIIVSILFERVIRLVRQSIKCPQLKKIVNRIFEEVMIMGFISMVIFTLNTSGIMKRVNLNLDGLTATEQLHFFEFFHYIVFLTMIYFILIVLLLLFIGTVMPKLIWKMKQSNNDEPGRTDSAGDDDDVLSEDTGVYDSSVLDEQVAVDRPHGGTNQFDSTVRPPYRSSTLKRQNSGMDLVLGSRAYSLLLQRYQREGWWFRFNLCKQWHLWKSFEILAYNICQNRSGYIYKNPAEMERLFGVKQERDDHGVPIRHKHITYERYHELCMRNLLFNITHLHFSAFFILLAICLLPALSPHYDHYIFIGIGGLLLLVNVVIFFKVLAILRGIVDDRLRVITMREIETRMRLENRNQNQNPTPNRPPLRLKVVATAVRSMIRMQMSALCHSQLHSHDDRFWFRSPKLLLRLFQFATVGQAFYLVWLSLVEIPTIAYFPGDTDEYLVPIMILLPVLALFVITPMTMPSLVLVMGLTGIFVELNADDEDEGLEHPMAPAQAKTRIRLMRRSFLRSHYTDNEELPLPIMSPEATYRQSPSTKGDFTMMTSPSNVFLRMYDSPTAAAAATEASPMHKRRSSMDNDIPHHKRSRSWTTTYNLNLNSNSGSWGRQSDRDDRRSFNLSSFAANANATAFPTSVYDPPTVPPRRSISSESASAVHSPQFMTWSHATIKRIDPDPVKKEGPKDADSPREENTTKQSTTVEANPVTDAFSGYCSKYGGYPDLV